MIEGNPGPGGGAHDASGRNPRRNHDRGHSHSVSIELEAVLKGVIGGDGDWRWDVIVNASMLVVNDDEESLFPAGPVSQRVVAPRDETLPVGDIVRRMLVVWHPAQDAAGKVARLDETVVRKPPRRRVARE